MIGHLEILPSNYGKGWPNTERSEMTLAGYRDDQAPLRNEALWGNRTTLGAGTCIDGTVVVTTNSISIAMVTSELMKISTATASTLIDGRRLEASRRPQT